MFKRFLASIMIIAALAAPALAQSTGANPGHLLSAASTNATSIKAGPGVLMTFAYIQTGTTAAYLRLYDTAGIPNCASATGVRANYPIQSNATSAGATLNLGPTGLAFFNGIGFCLTGGAADNDNTNATTGINLNWSYQ